MAERPIGYWLKLVDNLIEERFATILEEHGVTRTQWQLLNVLSNGATSPDRLTQAISPWLEGTTAAEHLAELVESGWVAVTEEEYSITERGTTAFTRLTEVVDGVRNSLSDGLTEEEYNTTVVTLERMARNLGYAE
jgi:DNA-binding MarR family transcriptional regulator